MVSNRAPCKNKRGQRIKGKNIPGAENSVLIHFVELITTESKMAEFLQYETVGKPTAAFCATGNKSADIETHHW